MHTPYDWITVLLFGVIASLFLQRSVGPEVEGDTPLAYLPPAAGCALANLAGNSGYHPGAILLLFATITYVVLRLRPGAFRR
ncbi:XrtV sorting system accessory protein [Sphingomonas sp. S2-65]|uniref:XrtV sorting system accessory protein n=1 Tax=Sphingomonas sp. S2-65 TaxID=2903960 RepID=UPI001F36928E|nr:XrtV sorting system accessory protein [Sphingomonas sp. S2-65]UYY57043.1 hypothetical protein LZ586_10125 [Sphingomonas sp. S2-65]